MNQEEIKNLFKKYRNNQLSDSEYEEFLNLLRNMGTDYLDYMSDEVQTDWEPSRQLLRKMQKAKKQQRKSARRKRLLIWSSAAAIVLMVIGFFFYPSEVVPEDLVYHTDFGKTRHIKLPDGTSVLLNANSTLSWKGAWEKNRLRQVNLDGEAFFDVTTIPNTPFEVNASDLRVHVLGTEFNVRNRDGDTDVFLHEGKVDIQINSVAEQGLMMKPGDYVHYDKGSQSMTVDENNRIEKKAAWVEGMLEFENKEVSDILKEYEILYGKKFRVDNPLLAKRRMDFSLPYSDWDLVRKALEIALDAKFEEVGDTIIVK